MNNCISSINILNLFMEICGDATVDSMRIYEKINNSKGRREALNVVCSLVILLAYLWLWVIWFCEVLAASLLMAVFCVPFRLADEHNLSVISMEIFIDPGTRRHVTAETCSSSRLSYLPGVLSFSLIGLIKLSLYESSIGSSVPTSYGSLF